MGRSEKRDRENQLLRERLSRLSAASRRINESLDFDQVLQEVRPIGQRRKQGGLFRPASSPAGQWLPAPTRCPRPEW